MKKTELNTIFTAKVNEYLVKGYTFNTQTMAGHQGEIAKIDLTNGEEVIRVVMEENGFNWDKEKDLFLNDKITITVGRATEVHFDTIWNKDLEVLDQEIFYKADRYSDYLITEEEAIENAEKNKARLMAKNQQTKENEDITDKAVIKALLPYIHTLKSCKSVKARHIKSVIKVNSSDGTYSYHIWIEKKNTTKVEVLSEKLLKNIRTSC